MSGRRGKNSKHTISEKYLEKLDIEAYFATVQKVTNHLYELEGCSYLEKRKPHEKAFAIFSLLVTSVLGGVCWPEAFLWVCDLRYGEVSAMLKDSSTDLIFEERFSSNYPVHVHPAVHFALAYLVDQRKAVKKSLNGRLIDLPLDAYLVPLKEEAGESQEEVDFRRRKYGLELIEHYFYEIVFELRISSSEQVEIQKRQAEQARKARKEKRKTDNSAKKHTEHREKEYLSLDTYLGVGRLLMVLDIYDLDTAYTTLGAMDAGTPPQDSLCDSDALDRIKRPLDESLGELL